MASVIGFGPRGSENRKSSGCRSRAWPQPAAGVDRLIEAEVLPRLLVAHSSRTPGPRLALVPSDVNLDDVARIAGLALALEAHALLTEVECFLRRGLSAEQIFVDLLAPAARYLGEEWKRDRLDFIDVTMGLWRLQEVLRELAARQPPIIHGLRAARSALFSPLPGDQHSFGAAMIEECFSRAGWQTQLLIDPNRAMLLARVAHQAVDLVGLTISCDCHIGSLRSLVMAVRSVSKNPDLCLMLGGSVMIDNPGIAEEVGADGTAPTAMAALDMAERLVEAPLHAATA